MKAVIFAGGVGTRLWPLSRRRSPKQFEKVIGDKSTLQLAVERLLPDFSWEDIYIATSGRYEAVVYQQLPKLPKANLISEPEIRDVGPAVGLVTAILYKKFGDVPIAILWSDHLVKKTSLFRKIIAVCEKIIKEKKQTIVFIGQKPRFASQNLGWIKFGQKKLQVDDVTFYNFEQFYYRPTLDEATQFFSHDRYTWNIGYFVTSLGYLWKLYHTYQPEMFTGLKKISQAYQTDEFPRMLKKVYATFPKISFDNAILEKLETRNAFVIAEDIGWSDVGAWEALKEALQRSPEENVSQGRVLVTDCHDSLVYNYTDQLVVTIDLNGYLVINTHDVVLVCHKNSVPKIKNLVESLAKSENENLI